MDYILSCPVVATDLSQGGEFVGPVPHAQGGELGGLVNLPQGGDLSELTVLALLDPLGTHCGLLDFPDDRVVAG